MMVFPISETYPAVYEDAHGTEQTTIYNNGEELRMAVRGVTFTGWMLDDFEPISGTTDDLLIPFTLHYNMLCDCVIQYQCAVPVSLKDKVALASLHVRLRLGKPRGKRGIDHESFLLTLLLEEQTYASSGKIGWLEDEFKELQAVLPQDTLLRTCVNCAFSDYEIGGNGAFGCIACFRDNKAEYLNASSNFGVARIWDTRSEWVQETYHCPEWERRRPGTGYRG